MKDGGVQLLAFYQESEIEFDAPGTAPTATTVSTSQEDSALLTFAESTWCIGRLQKNVPVVFSDLRDLPYAKVNRYVVLTILVIELP
jgi:hypothetical protein